MTLSPRVLIAGAGIGGLTAGLALAQRGFLVDISEQATTLEEAGAGVQIAANGSRLLLALGLGADLMSYGSEIGGKSIRLWSTGQEWRFLGLGRSSVEKYGAPYVVLHRADLQKLLVDALLRQAPDALHLNSRCAGIEQQGDGVALLLADGRRVRGDLLIGADGIHSSVRGAILAEKPATFTGCMAWRGVVPADGLPSSISVESGAVWISPKAHIIHYPIRHGRELNFVGVVERDDWAAESWSTLGTHEECHRDFEGWHSDAQAMIDAMDRVYKWGLFLHGTMETWGEGPVTLLGDAAHAALPFLAQGANMAIEDGFVLARCLQACSGDPLAGLRRYEDLRIARNNKVIEVAAEQLNREHSPLLADPVLAEQYIAEEWGTQQVKDRYDWLYTYDGTTVEVA
jgi:salicylate hydroxylase